MNNIIFSTEFAVLVIAIGVILQGIAILLLKKYVDRQIDMAAKALIKLMTIDINLSDFMKSIDRDFDKETKPKRKYNKKAK